MNNVYLPLIGSLVVSLLFAFSSPCTGQSTVEQAWNTEYTEISAQIENRKTWNNKYRQRLDTEALDREALILPGDNDPLDVVIRRTGALFHFLNEKKFCTPETLNEFRPGLNRLLELAKSASDPASRKKLFLEACALRRNIAFANSLFDFNSAVCMLEQPGPHRVMEQARAVYPGHATGGGPILLKNIKGKPEVEPLLKGVQVSAGAWKGRELVDKFSGLELNCDGRNILFAASTGDDVWHVFRFNLESKELVQLTSGTEDDFDPCELPSGRIVFTSTRRGGVGRCVLTPHSLTYTLFSMEPDGSDIICLSFHETDEWAPSISHDGKIVYTRWDYVDRHWGTAHHFWECYPDGRDPRNLHGNYPLPLSSMYDGITPNDYGKEKFVYGRLLRPDVEMSFRAVPDSPKFTATAVGHHEGFSGSLVLLDKRIPDDGMMSQLRRITPEYPFPEVERGGRHAYGTAWPLSEDFYLCNFQRGLYLLDRFGNREVIYEPAEGPYLVRDPFPLRPRGVPPVLPVQTWQGKRAALPDHCRATISVMNVYHADAAATLPKDIKVKWMRIVEVIPQLQDNWFSIESVSQVSFATDSIGRMPLGIVPVEEDGSVYCEAPVGKPLYFQLLDEKGMAVHSMRSATYVHPGEQMSCMGCHEDKWKAVRKPSNPKALQRAPSKLEPEVSSGAMPFNFCQLVKIPVFDRKCVDCHKKNPKAPNMSYASLATHRLVFSYPGEYSSLYLSGVGGSRTTPGHFGARVSGLMKALETLPQHKDVKLTAEELRRITLWLDLNSNEIGWIGDDRSQIAAQKRGEASWPPVDVDPSHPTGVEKDFPVYVPK